MIKDSRRLANDLMGEIEEVRARVARINRFIACEASDDVGDMQLGLLRIQIHAMEAYIAILVMRLQDVQAKVKVA